MFRTQSGAGPASSRLGDQHSRRGHGRRSTASDG